MRVYRADRIEGDLATGPPAAFTVPADFRADAYLEDRPWDYGDGRATEVTIRVEPGHEVGVIQAAGANAVASLEPDGSTSIRIRAIEIARDRQLRSRLRRARRDRVAARGA